MNIPWGLSVPFDFDKTYLCVTGRMGLFESGTSLYFGALFHPKPASAVPAYRFVQKLFAHSQLEQIAQLLSIGTSRLVSPREASDILLSAHFFDGVEGKPVVVKTKEHVVNSGRAQGHRFMAYEFTPGAFLTVSKPLSLECPCGIARVQCEYHR